MGSGKILVAAVLKQDSDSLDVASRFLGLAGQRENVEIGGILFSDPGQKDIISKIKVLHPDLLVTIDLQGFEQGTLTDNISYNLLDCKQLHLLLHDQLPNEHFLSRQLSIAMFFCCAGNSYFEYLKQCYPNLPYLKVLQGWRADTGKDAEAQNAETLYRAFQEVLSLSMLKGGRCPFPESDKETNGIIM